MLDRVENASFIINLVLIDKNSQISGIPYQVFTATLQARQIITYVRARRCRSGNLDARS